MSEEMTEVGHYSHQVEEEIGEVNEAPDSILSQLRQRREELTHERHIDLPIPGYGGLLAGRYHPISYTKIRNIGQRVSKMRDETKRELYVSADTLISACDALLYWDERSSKYAPLGDGEVRFDSESEIKEILDLDSSLDTARKVLFAVFNNDLNVITHSNELIEWQSGDEYAEVEEQLVGESQGTG